MNNSIKVLSTRLVIYTCTASMYRVKDRTEYTYSLELSSLSINTYFTKEEQVTIQSLVFVFYRNYLFAFAHFCRRMHIYGIVTINNEAFTGVCISKEVECSFKTVSKQKTTILVIILA